MRGADVLVKTLADAGVDRLFTLSGNQIMPVFDACIDAGIDLVHVRHEAAAVHMADAWARLTGKTGVALLTAGPGHANGVSALYTALQSESPVLLISGHTSVSHLGKGGFQEMAQVDLAAPLCKDALLINSAEQIRNCTRTALHMACDGRPGPVHLSTPFDLLEAETGDQIADTGEIMASAPLDPATIETVYGYLRSAKRPLILNGSALMREPGLGFLQSFALKTGIPVVGMESPRGVNDPALGRLSNVLARADLVLLLAKSLDFTLRFGESLATDCTVLQIDPDPAMLLRTRRNLAEPGRLLLSEKGDGLTWAENLLTFSQAAGSAAESSREWYEEVEGEIRFRPEEWATLRSTAEPGLHPAEVCRVLQPFIERSPQPVLIADGGEFGQWAQACLSAPQRLINGPAGAIGSALPFAAAARMACPQADVFALLGDGTFGFHMAEIDTAVRYKLPYIAIVGNDARWNAEHQIQLQKYGPDRLAGCELLPTRYDLVAQAMGAQGEYVTRAAQLPQALERALASRLPVCINIKLEGHPAPRY